MSPVETNLYYLQSRYYNPEWGRFINADDPAYLGADGTPVSYNLFAYCGNNPVMGYDPAGEWDWWGVIAGAVIVVAGIVATVAAVSTGSFGAIEVGVSIITTGGIMTYAAATDSTMVMDLSVSIPLVNLYGKVGVSLLVDFAGDEVIAYNHGGGGIGCGGGLTYSVGLVSNYSDPEDYSKDFADVNVGRGVGIDHCWNPFELYPTAPKATCVSFSYPISTGFGVGYDYYSAPKRLFGW